MMKLHELDLEDQEELHNGPIKYNYEERKDSERISYNEFFWEYMNRNELIIIGNVSNEWPCRKQWVQKDEVNFDFLSNKFNDLVVSIILFFIVFECSFPFNNYRTFKAGKSFC